MILIAGVESVGAYAADLLQRGYEVRIIRRAKGGGLLL